MIKRKTSLPNCTLGLSPNLPAGLVSRPIFIFALKNVPVVITIDLQLITLPFSFLFNYAIFLFERYFTINLYLQYNAHLT